MRFVKIIIVLLLLLDSKSMASTYFVSFKHKRSHEYSIAYPEKYLSAKSIKRRLRQSLLVDSTDLPVDRRYVQEIQSKVKRVVYSSKWLNGMLVEASADQVSALFANPIVKNVVVVYSSTSKSVGNKLEDPVAVGEPGDFFDESFVESFKQVNLIKGQLLHEKNLTGQGVLIAILDESFSNYRNLEAFSGMQSRVVDSSDFISAGNLTRSSDGHGTKVLSLLAGNLSGRYLGAAPLANFALYITESSRFEQIYEEYAWCLAAERADSVGCDIISSSLGYNWFDISQMNHSPADLGKGVAPISIAANMAVSKGMLTVVSAGNEGNKPWGYVTFPADSPDVIAVGAVTSAGRLGIFSSLGYPNSMKPDLACMGVSVALIDNNGNVVRGSGTSYSAPQVAGFAACLWQAYPNATASEIKRAILQSSSISADPNNEIGYGIPDFGKAFMLLKEQQSSQEQAAVVFPNPFSSTITVEVPNSYTGGASYYFYNSRGGLITTGTLNVVAGRARIDGLDGIGSGIVLFRLIFDGGKSTKKLVKVN